MLNSKFSEPIHLITESLYSFTSPFLFPTPQPLKHFILCFYEFSLKYSIINDAIQYLSFSIWLILLSMVFSKLIYVVANDKVSFLS